MPGKVKLLIATTNKKKIEEFRALLYGLPVDCISLSDVDGISEVEETGKTFEENASIKALGYGKQTGLLSMGEDSGICCKALEGAPGIYSARFAGQDKNDAANNEKLLSLLENRKDSEREAFYESQIALALPEKIIGAVGGDVHGFIATEPMGNGGFGYDPIFFYPPFNKTFGQVTDSEKNKVSHRGVASLKFRLLLFAYLSGKWAIQDSNL